MNERDALRLTVSGPTELVVQLPAGGQAAVDGDGASDQPTAGREPASPRPYLLRPSAGDAAAGRRRAEVVVDGWRFEVVAEDAHRAALRERAARAAAAHAGAGRATLRAQIPGRVTRVWVAAGEQVEQGQRLLAIEAMKMENEIRAPRAGVIEHLAVEAGQVVELNDELLVVGHAEPAS